MVDRVFILVPAYNAAATIERVFARIPVEVKQRIVRYVVVNDGSTDATAAALVRLATEYPALTTLTHEVNRGYGGAMKTLLTHAVEQKADVALVIRSGAYCPSEWMTIAMSAFCST